VFREYFCAEALARAASSSELENLPVLDRLDELLRDASWSEVLEMFVELVDQRSPSALIYRRIGMTLPGAALLRRVATRMTSPSDLLVEASVLPPDG
jgi:hypothetical protein